MVARRDERAFIARYSAISLTVLVAQCLVTAFLVRRQRQIDGVRSTAFPSVADAVTLGRAAIGAHALGFVAATRCSSARFTGPLCWAPLLGAVTVGDWTDGWCARHLGQESTWGARLDVETDSWLTLCSACAAVTVGGLPAYVVLPPFARHALFWVALVQGAHLPYRHRGAWWERAIGTAQMAVLLGSLVQRPCAGKRVLRRMTDTVSLLSAVSLVLQWLPILTEGGEDADSQTR